MHRVIKSTIIALSVAAIGVSIALLAKACPFCSAVQLTLAQEMKGADAVVVAELTELPAATCRNRQRICSGHQRAFGQIEIPNCGSAQRGGAAEEDEASRNHLLGRCSDRQPVFDYGDRSEIAFLGDAHSADQAEPRVCRSTAEAT